MSIRNASVKLGLVGIVAAGLLAACNPTVTTLPVSVPVSATPAAQTANFATRPANASLRIITPTSNAVLPVGPVKVVVEYAGPALVPAAQAAQLEQYHLHYLLDQDAKAYINTGIPVPAGNTKIIHSAATEVSFENVAPGEHSLTIIMSGNNHVAVSPPLADTAVFTVR